MSQQKTNQREHPKRDTFPRVFPVQNEQAPKRCLRVLKQASIVHLNLPKRIMQAPLKTSVATTKCCSRWPVSSCWRQNHDRVTPRSNPSNLTRSPRLAGSATERPSCKRRSQRMLMITSKPSFWTPGISSLLPKPASVSTLYFLPVFSKQVRSTTAQTMGRRPRRDLKQLCIQRWTLARVVRITLVVGQP